MSDVTWTEGLSAVGSIATPLVVVVFGVLFSRRQSRNDELLRARIRYYEELAPDVNTLMCYMTFIGPWRDLAPADIVDLKRRLDARFFCAAPLFSDPIRSAYENLMSECFSTFSRWGEDAQIRSGPYRRREAWRGKSAWTSSWDQMFTKGESDPISAQEQTSIREAHDRLVAALVRDLDLTRARSEYTTTTSFALNAHAPTQKEVAGKE